MQVGFIGLGNMGLPLARHLLDAGFELTVFNQTANWSALAKLSAKRAGLDDGESVAQAANRLPDN